MRGGRRGELPSEEPHLCPSGADLFLAAEPGFMAFILLYAVKYTLIAARIISRTKAGDAWVVQFVQSLKLQNYGFNLDNMAIVPDKTGPRGKGPASADKRLTHFIDNDLENLWSITNDQNGNCGDSIEGLIHYTGSAPRGELISEEWRKCASS